MAIFSRSLCFALSGALVLPALPAGATALPGAAQAAKMETAHQWGRNWHRRHHRDRIDVGDVLTGVLILGTIATVIDATTKTSRRDRDDRRDRYPNDDRRYPDSDAYPSDNNRYPDDGYGQNSEDQAVNDCAVAAERQASGGNIVAQVRDIQDVQSTGRGYQVRGTLDTRINYRAGVSASRSFSCRWDNGQVTNLEMI